MRSAIISLISCLACTLLIVYAATVFYPKWNNKGAESSLGWDASTYYWYLPATFIYNDLKHQKFGDSIIAQYNFTPGFIQSYGYKDSNRVITYSSGLALIQLPAFAVAHFLAKPLGYKQDGFSKPYQCAIQVWAIIIAIVGLWLFRKFMLRYYSDTVTAIILVMLVGGTCFLNYTAIDATLTHAPLFTIYVLLLLCTDNYYVKAQSRYAVIIGLLIGLAILIRPSEVVALFIPLCWGMESLSRISISTRFKFLFARRKHFLLATVCIIFIGSLQVVYWMYVTGKPVVYSYDDKTFSWLSPHTWKYLASTTSGWIMYNPVVLFVFIGLPFFIKYGRNRVAVLAFFMLNMYIITAWDIWWYAGIGGRAMVQSYAVSLIIAASLFERIFKRKVWICVTAPVFVLCLYVSFWVHYHAHRSRGLYNPVFMSGRYYWSVIGRWKPDKEKLKLQDARDIYTGKLVGQTLLYENTFAVEEVLLVASRTNSNIFTVTEMPHGKMWLRLQCKYSSLAREWEEWKMFRTRIHFKNGDREIKGEDYKPQRFLDDNLQKVIHYDIRIPDETFDRIEISFLNENSDVDMLIDDVKLWAYNDTR